MNWREYEYLFRCWFLEQFPCLQWFTRKTDDQQDWVISHLECDFDGSEEDYRSEFWESDGFSLATYDMHCALEREISVSE